jgi:hypothetical protein
MMAWPTEASPGTACAAQSPIMSCHCQQDYAVCAALAEEASGGYMYSMQWVEVIYTFQRRLSFLAYPLPLLYVGNG